MNPGLIISIYSTAMNQYIELAKQLDKEVLAKVLKIRLLELKAENKVLDLELLRATQPSVVPPQQGSNVDGQMGDPFPLTTEQLTDAAREWVKSNPPIAGTEVDVYYDMYWGAHRYSLSNKDFEWEARRQLGVAPSYSMAIIKGRQVLIRKW